FELYYQAQYKLDNHETHIAAIESLVRWKHPELGMISPGEFIPIAEEAGLIRPITGWVIDEASRQALLWQQQGYRPGKIGINVSAAELMHIGLVEDILAHISKAGAEAEWFEIEITETAAMSQPDTAISIMQKLIDSGIQVAIDDFGTGYSSLAYLKRLPANHLKIDIAFIRHLQDNAEDAVIVRAIIAMAHALGMTVIAEGVETRAQLDFLRQEGCDFIQGYLLAKPMSASDTTVLLKDNLHAPG
ncbi:MAG: EAL domain-containing protein, partial [Mariprofundus sp.]|nr:EAL domain-containing protein [Mariprofundus sp.]